MLVQAQAVLAGSAVAWGAQDLSVHESGAYTGEVSAAMLRDFGVRYAIVGHSERRQYHGETDTQVAEKARAALACGITPIVCVGETLADPENPVALPLIHVDEPAISMTIGTNTSPLVGKGGPEADELLRCRRVRDGDEDPRGKGDRPR